MDKKRAKEIIASQEMVNVTYNDDLIYIENVNQTKDTVSIHSINRPEQTQEVQLTQLVEQ